MAYNKDTDYMAIIQNPNTSASDRRAAEASRNEKIAAMNSSGTNTGGYKATYDHGNAPAGYTGSTKATGGTSSAAQNIIDQMNANSLKWYTDPANKAKYEQANQQLSQQLSALSEADNSGGVTSYTPKYDSATGTWSVASNYAGGALQQLPQQQQQVGTNTPVLAGLELGDKYGINYNQSSIQALLDAATKSQYALRNQQQVQSENKFYNTMLDTQGTALDTLRKSQASAVATGASRGMAAANELSAILNLQQVSADESTLLAQNRDNLNVEEAAAYKQNASDSLNTSNTLKQAIANLAATKYGYDTQGYAANLSYLAALADVAAQKYSSDSTLSGVKYNADANVAAAKATASKYGSSGYTYTGGNGGTGTGTPTSTGTPNTDALDLKLAANENTIVPENQSYSITGDGAGGYIIKNFKASDGTTGNLTVDKFEMDKIINNGWNPNAVYEDNFGAASYKYKFDTNPNKKMSVDEVNAYYKKYGKYPDGWELTTSPTYGNPYAINIPTPTYTGKTSENNYSLTGNQGQKVSVGQGNYAITWTYSAKSGTWTDSTGRSKNVNDFKTYLANQPQAYVKVLN